MAAGSVKLQALLRDFQQIASMAGYANHAMDGPQLRLFFTLYGRLTVDSPEAGLALAPRLLAWSENLSTQMREGSSSAILPPQIQVSAPQTLPDGRYYLVATLTFATKVTESSYLRVRTAVLAAYQAAVALRERGFDEGNSPAAPTPPTQPMETSGEVVPEAPAPPIRIELDLEDRP
ncbi:MAG: hypothetical protein HY823_13610 [Acidobacteria bacterium]|nr:hypothetical protein [Acidobacteriota bacterium]